MLLLDIITSVQTQVFSPRQDELTDPESWTENQKLESSWLWKLGLRSGWWLIPSSLFFPLKKNNNNNKKKSTLTQRPSWSRFEAYFPLFCLALCNKCCTFLYYSLASVGWFCWALGDRPQVWLSYNFHNHKGTTIPCRHLDHGTLAAGQWWLSNPS